MKKILSLTALLFLYSLISAQNNQGINTHAKLPEIITPNSEYSFEVVLHKPAIQPFAVYEQKFPDGIELIPEKTGLAISDFKENTLTVSWIRLPKNTKVKLRFKLKTRNIPEGRYKTVGMLNYLYANRKGITSTDTLEFIVLKDTNKKPPQKTAESTEDKDKPEKNQAEDTTDKKTPAKPQSITCTRSYTVKPADKGKRCKITIQIHNTGNIGAARLKEEFPDNYTVEVIKTGGATINKAADAVTFRWDKFPKKKQLSLSYELYGKNTSKRPTVKGSVAYAEGNKITEIKIENQQ